jgi:LysM repeat protein
MAPQCSIASCSELIACLNAGTAPGGGSIALSGALFDAAQTLADALLLPSLTITQRDPETPLIQPKPPCVAIVGKAVLFPSGPAPQIEYEVEVQCQVAGSEVLLLLDATPPAGWTFDKNFPPFPEYYGVFKSQLRWLPSFYDGIVIANPHFWIATVAQQPHPQGLSFTGSLDLTQGSLASLGDYFPNAKKVALHGSVTLRANTYPTLDLTGDLPDYSIPQFSDLSLKFGTTDAGTTPAASTLQLVASTKIGDFPKINLSTPILEGKFVWVITGTIEEAEKYGLGAGLQALTTYARVQNLPLPSGLDTFGFHLQSVTVSIVPGSKPTIDMIGFRIAGPKKSWSAPILGLGISDLFVEWQVISPFNDPQLIGTLGGTLVLGSGATEARLLLQVDLGDIFAATAPDVTISAQLDPDYPVSVGALVQQFTGIDTGLDLTISKFLLEANTGPRTLQFTAGLTGKWPFPVPLIEFRDTDFFFLYTPNKVTGFASVRVSIASFDFLVKANYAGKGEGWQFSGQLASDSQGKTLQDFVDSVTGKKYPSLPANLGNVTLERFMVSFDTKTEAFSFDGVLAWPFVFDEGFINVTLTAELSLQSPAPVQGKRSYSGFVSGNLAINNFSVGVVYSFDIENNSTISFVVRYKGASLTAIFSKDKETGDRILTVNLGGVTFGGIVEYLVNLVDPKLGFTLSSPWDVLNEISFDNLALTVNLTTKEVGIKYDLNKDLGIIAIETIGLAYVNKAGRKTVDISITGRFFDEKYDEKDPLAWDLLNDPPPTPPGKGPEFLDLRYLGVGQNIGFRDATNFQKVQDVIDALESDFLPVDPDDQNQNPLSSPLLANLKFAGDGRWLIGADMTFIGAISISVVFNDPTLYGIRIALSGDKVKNFAGLDFEILYKKITDTIGVYHIELTLPEAFRQFELGAASVTLPIIVIDIYTNGNFRIDLGFPVGLDFSRSFCVQVGPFTGFGGIYFALLDGATSERVPKITNGNFSPVIEAGVALSVGLGRSFNKGVISASATITMVTIVEGVFGWFNPNDRSVGNALYYWVQGTAAIVGKVEGKIDFFIIQADFKITASAQVTLTIESYAPIEVELVVSVEVSISVKVLFFRISLSFSTSLELSFTIGSRSPTPWIVDASQPPPLTLRQQIAPQGRRRLSGALLQRRLLAALEDAPGSFDWAPRAVFTEIQHVSLSLVPALTVASPDAIMATHDTASLPGGPQYQVVMSLFAPNSVPTQARRAREVRMVAHPDAAATPFNLLVSGMLQWALSSYTRAPGMSGLPPPAEYALASDLDALSRYLGDPNNWQNVFTYDALAALMELNYVLEITTPAGPTGLVHPSGPLAAGATAPEVAATLFPMIPDLAMAPKGLPPVMFWDYHCVTRDYETALQAYYAQLRVAAGASGPSSASIERRATNFRTQPGPVGCAGGMESLSSFVFRDYFSMLAKGAINGAIDLLKAYPYEPTGGRGPTGISGPTGPSGPSESLASIAQQFRGLDLRFRTRRGDTIGTIAGRFGLAPSVLQNANAHLLGFAHHEALPLGTLVAVNAGVTPAAIVSANQGYPLQYNPWNPVPMTISGAKHQVKAPGGKSESLRAICANYLIQDPASVFTFLAPTKPPSNPNVANPSLLQPGAQMTIPGHAFQVASPIDNVQALVAAFFFVRSIGPAQPGQDPWYSYVQFYEQWIEDNLLAAPTGATAWNIPLVGLTGGNLTVTGTGQYVPQGATGSALAPDTTALAAGYFAMTQLGPAPYTDAFQDFQRNVSPTGPTGTYAIAPFPYTIRPGDTVSGIAQLFGVGVDNLARFNAGATGMLAPLSVLALPTLSYPIAEGDTFASVAADFDLTLDALADSIAKNAGILQPYVAGATPLTIPDVPGRNADKLLSDLVTFGRFNDISGMVTRFLLHGMRTPQPGSEVGATFPPGTPLWGLYEMTGQQFPLPAGASGPSGQFNVVFTKGATADWICLGPTGPTGPSAPTGPICQDELVVHFGPDFFADMPSLTLDPIVQAGPGSLPLYRDTPRRYSMPESIHWQSATTPVLPGPTGPAKPRGGQPSIWTFPQSLIDIAARGPSGPTASPQYELMIANPNDPSGDSDVAVAHYCWASAIDVRIQRVPGTAGTGAMPNSYLLLGADQDGRDLLLSAYTFIEQVAPYGQLFILYPPSATSSNSKGLASDSVDPEQTFLLKTNLTTVTRSNQGSFVSATSLQPSGSYYARLAAVPDFLRLAWEASVTGSGGFYLNYVNMNGGGGLPDTLFANGDIATITLLVLANPQDNRWTPDLGLYPMNNRAVVGDTIDPGSSRLYTRLVNPTRSDLVRVASVAPGNAGFYMVGLNPDPGGTGPLGPTGETRNLYNLLGFQIRANGDFKESNEGLPAGPSDIPLQGVSGPTGPSTWWYQQVLPVYKFGRVNNTPASAALPAVADNPYAGITGPIGPSGQRPLSTVAIELAYHDVYGNQTDATRPPGTVVAPVGYIDDLIGVSSWPAAGADFAFVSGPSASVVLDTTASMQLDKYAPSGSSYGYDQSSQAAAADADRYRQIFYQVQQIDLRFGLQTNLGQPTIDPDSLKAAMLAFVSKAKVFVDAAASQRQSSYTTIAGDTLTAIADTYSVTVPALVGENATQPVASLFQGKIVRPSLATAGPMNTLTLLVANENSTPFPPVCGPNGPPDCAPNGEVTGVFRLAQPGVAAGVLLGSTGPNGPALTPGELLSNNQAAPLTPGIDLRTAARIDAAPQNASTLAAAAAALQCAVYALVPDPDAGPGPLPIGLFVDNYTASGVVTPNLSITIDGKTISTGATPTFQSVQAAFAAAGLDAGTSPADPATGNFVVKLATVSCIFAPDAKLTHADFIVPQPPPSKTGPAVPVFSISNLPAGCGPLADLAEKNRIVPNFFYAGTPIYLNACCYQPKPLDTFSSLADQFKLPIDQLAQYNASAPLQGSVALLIPNLTYLATSSSADAPYAPTASDSLDSIATAVGATAPVLAAINRYLPGIFADGVVIPGGSMFKPGPLASLQSVADALGLPFDQFISNIAGATGLYRTNGVVIAPLLTIPSAKPSAVAQKFNIQSADGTANGVTALFTANRSLEKFLFKDAMISGPTGTTPLKVGAHDTINTIMWRFQQKPQNVVVSIDQLAAANASNPGLLTVGQPFLLPPNPTKVASTVTPSIPPSGGAGESAIVFPVTAAVRMTRAQGLVAPDFQGATAVYQNTSRYAPRGATQGSSTLGLAKFARDFETAFAAYRLKCAIAKTEAVSDPERAGQIWAVNFGPTGVSQFAVQASMPQFYALAPLSVELLTRTPLVRPYTSGVGLGPAVPTKFDAVDLDSWMAQFLSTVDLFLSTPYAVPAFQLPATGPTGSPLFAEITPSTAPATDGPVGFAGRPGVSGIGRSAPAMFGATGTTGADGPGNYDDIVDAKYQVAGALQNDVVPILKGVGPTGGYYGGVAQETLYEQMLVQLSNAYDVNAVVQYPVEVQSPCITPVGPTGPIPPRVSLKIVPDLYAVPTGASAGTLQDAVDYFGVSVPFLAETIGEVQGLLKVDAPVIYGPIGLAYRIRASDTLNIVAHSFGVPTDPNAPGYWETWTRFAEAIATQPIIVAGGSYPVVKIERVIDQGDALDTIADFFGVDAATVAEANQSRKGLLALPQTLTLDGYDAYPVKPTDTFASIAASATPKSPNTTPLTVGRLGDLISSSGKLHVGAMLYLTQTLPDFTMSGGKVSLGPVGSQGLAPALSLLFSIKHPKEYRKVFLNLKYVINEVEFGISEVAGTDGYQASSWLTLLVPIGSGQGTDVGIATGLGQVQIPIPLRSYPIPPTLVAQSGFPTVQTLPPVTPAEAVSQGRQWDYRFDFRSTNSAQDTDHVEVRFNTPGPTGPGADLFLTRTDLVFAALAEFMAAYPALSIDLARLPKLSTGAPDPVASIAVQVLDIFATGVASALLKSTVAGFAEAQWPELRYVYRLRTTAVNDQFRDLRLTLESGPTGAGPLWPDVLVESLTGASSGTGPDTGFLPLSPYGPTGGITANYTYPPGFPMSVPITQRFRFTARDVIQNRNAWSGIYLTRNDDLISSRPLGSVSPTGPTGPQEPVTTSTAFLYQTPLVRFIDPLTPFLVDSSMIDVSGLTGPSLAGTTTSRTLAGHIEAMLDAVLELGAMSPVKADSHISVLCNYGFPVAGEGPEAIFATVPVRLVPSRLMTAGAKTAFAAELSKSIKRWPGWPSVSRQGVLIMDLSVFAPESGADGLGEQLKPFLEFEDLRIPIASISDAG